MTDHELLDLSTSAERTSLAWQRSGLSMIAVGALLIHSHTKLLSGLAGWTLIGTGLLTTALVGPWRYRAVLVRVRSGTSPAAHGVVLLAAAVVCLTALVTVGVVLFP
ncbi:MAG TPA: DUF202 domain-containing protein [Pseudonocardiaceae bacterium]